MILIDTNLLLYAYSPSFPQHEAARAWFEERMNSGLRVGLPWISIWSFVRIASNPRVFTPAASVTEAWSRVQEWLDRPNVWHPQPGPEHRRILTQTLEGLSGGHRLVPDAALAALAIEHGLTLCSSDGDFARFRGLRWENPLTPPRRPPARRA